MHSISTLLAAMCLDRKQTQPKKNRNRKTVSALMGNVTAEWLEKMKLLMALLALQFCFAGSHIVSRVALNIGISKIVYPIYRNTVALSLLAPCAYFLER